MTPISKAFVVFELMNRLDVAVLRVRVGTMLCRQWTPLVDHLLFETQQMVPTWTARALA